MWCKKRNNLQTFQLVINDLIRCGNYVVGCSSIIFVLAEIHQGKEIRNCCNRILLEIVKRIFVSVNTLRPRQGGRHFPDDIFKRIFLNENVWILIKITLKFVPRGTINNIPALVQIMAWRRPGGKPLSEPMLVFVSTYICVTRPQWVKSISLPKILSSFKYGCRPLRSKADANDPEA